jgi:hypothetical protein
MLDSGATSFFVSRRFYDGLPKPGADFPYLSAPFPRGSSVLGPGDYRLGAQPVLSAG